MDYRIVEKPAFKVVGKAIRVCTKDGENSRRIPQFWDECWQDGTCSKLEGMISDDGVLGHAILGICMEFQPEQGEFTYMAAVEETESNAPEAKGNKPKGFVEKDIPSSTWAVFESVGPMPDAIQKVWGRIFSEFFPSTGYIHAGGPEGDPELEVYLPGDSSDAAYRCEVWIPVQKATVK